jgi:AbrB family looped-hinge helix DNA binding protein
MPSGNIATSATVSRIGQRRQVIIPKRVFDALKLRAGDFVEVSAEGGRLEMRPKRLVDIGDEVLSASEAAKVRCGEAEIKAGRSQSWRSVKDELAS